MCLSFCPWGSGIPACIADGIPACLAGLQGGWYPSMPCRSPGPHPGGKLRGLAWGGLQAHTWGSLQAHTWGVSQHALRQTRPLPADGYCCRQYASYWNAFLLCMQTCRMFADVGSVCTIRITIKLSLNFQ